MEQQTEYVLAAEQERHLAERVKEAREYLGLSQEFVADQIGISRPAMSALETGKRKVSSIELHRLAQLLKKPLTYFFDDDEVLSAPQDDTARALYRASKGLSEQDQQQVLRFAEFLRQAGRAPSLTSTDQS
ncbi:transcriptional regulator with XRE-family HTH domain [Deinococcus metalli]|uniref:Transcriptional regulator with XRE-family HTH domain n=1 Tax=Deinococcus metalli TaxID=1141878 RepID=A0A7W8NRR7_9DEIO|nr:helix-turn-helix transcriptional regulator [Deinococcus metalli]MBB5379266.1 transcriptional regulator with XRE-family HTH domain [Deinococcus metalli]GHF65991.1 hypothetical protein GCM10017781_47140 [Deinococcus metalli]